MTIVKCILKVLQQNYYVNAYDNSHNTVFLHLFLSLKNKGNKHPHAVLHVSRKAHLSHEPLFLFHADVEKLGLVQDLLQGQAVCITILMPRLSEGEKHTDLHKEEPTHTHTHVGGLYTVYETVRSTDGTTNAHVKRKICQFKCTGFSKRTGGGGDRQRV